MRSILKVNWDSKLPIYNISQSELQKKEINTLLLDVDGISQSELQKKRNSFIITRRGWDSSK
jgi:hypothetical protein